MNAVIGQKRKSYSGTLGTVPMPIPMGMVCIVYEPIGEVTVEGTYKNGSTTFSQELTGYGPGSSIPFSSASFSYVYQSAGSGSCVYIFLPPSLASSFYLDSVQPQLVATTLSKVITSKAFTVGTALLLDTVPSGLQWKLLRVGFHLVASWGDQPGDTLQAGLAIASGLSDIDAVPLVQANATTSAASVFASGGVGITTLPTDPLISSFSPWSALPQMGAGDILELISAGDTPTGGSVATVTYVVLQSQASD
uniref:Uncharacterized protein n=1 Tax=uncultured prokaryote TaxID=198431 RepID=A0A0H5Q3B2_9ZZZZ|nr:hypothetical protein [uncultured prokaryote]